MNKHKRVVSFILALCLLFSTLLPEPLHANAAKNIYSLFFLNLSKTAMTLYINQPNSTLFTHIAHYNTSDYSDEAYDNAYTKILNDLVCTISDTSVAQFVTNTSYYPDGTITYDTAKKLTKNGRPNLIGLSEGSATLTIKSKILNTSLKCKITVKNAELKADNTAFYNGNKYTFSIHGNAAATSFSSSNTKVATINETTGVMTTKSTGTTTISCVGDDGKTYKYKVKVKKRGLSYTKLTSYYYTGMIDGYYNSFPLVAKGIDVKSWKSSDSKVCKVIKYGNIGLLEMRGTGKSTITCTAKDGTTYKCKLTVTGGKTWGGLNNGYRPTLSTLKKHGYYKDINKIHDYGKVIVTIVETDHKVALNNGNKQMDAEKLYYGEQIFNERYPGAKIKSLSFGDYLCFTNDKKTKSGRLRVSCYYVAD